MAKKMTNPTKVVTGPNTRWSYCNVWEPKEDDNGKAKYSICLLIDKSDTAVIAKIRAAIQAAYDEGIGKLKGNGKSAPSLASLRSVLHDGDEERSEDEAYRNKLYVNAKSITAPEIVDADRQPILTRSEVYSGVYGRASITFYAYNTGSARGIACGLGNLQKIKDGPPLGGRSTAEDDFADLDDDDDDFLN